MKTTSKIIVYLVLVTFVTASVAVMPAAAMGDLSTALADKGRRKPRPKDPPDSEKDGKRDDRRKPPPRDDGGTRPPREKGDPPDHSRGEQPEPPPPEPPGWYDIYGVHEYYYYYEDDYIYDSYEDRYVPRTESAELVGLYGLAAATVMVLNLVYSSDDDRSHNALGVTGMALGATGVIWSFNADAPWEQRTLFITGLFSVGFALLNWTSEDREDPYVENRYFPSESIRPAAGVSFSF
jgi:hypothetical protein